MILVMLGTQNNSFHRLLEEVEKNIENETIQEDVIVQAGYTKFESKHMQIFDLIPKEKLEELQEKANLIITHGGVGSIISSIEKDKKVIDKLIKDIEEVRDKTPNEIDEVEKKRLEQIDYLLDKFKEVNTSDEQAKEFIEKQYNNLLEDKEKIKDGGKLYTKITDLLTNNSVINKSASKMNDKELLTFITRYISVPLPPPIKQEDFNDLVKVGIKEDNREALWRLAVNYDKKMDFTLIEDYFIDKRDSYYLIELVSATDSVNLDNIVSKVVATNDRKFMIDLANRSLELSIFTKEDIDKIKEKYNL